MDGVHLSIDDTMAKIEEQKWLIGSNIQEIPKPFIDEMVKTCGGCKFGQQSTHISGEGRSFRQYTEHHKIPVSEKDEFLNNLKATYSVCLKPIYKYSRVFPNAFTVFIYVCHRGTRFSGKNLNMIIIPICKDYVPLQNMLGANLQSKSYAQMT